MVINLNLNLLITGNKIDFTQFLLILNEESQKNDPVSEIYTALRLIDADNMKRFELICLMSTMGEKMSKIETENVLNAMTLISAPNEKCSINNIIERILRFTQQQIV